MYASTSNSFLPLLDNKVLFHDDSGSYGLLSAAF
jgi:hypothetical protein